MAWGAPVPRAEGASDPADGCGPWGAGPSWWIAVSLIVLGLIVTVVLAGVLLGWGPPGASGPGPYPGWWPLFPLGFFLVVVLLLFVVRGGFWGRWGWGHPYGPWAGSAEEVLRRRFARGEISPEQFRQMRRELAEARRP